MGLTAKYGCKKTIDTLEYHDIVLSDTVSVFKKRSHSRQWFILCFVQTPDGYMAVLSIFTQN